MVLRFFSFLVLLFTISYSYNSLAKVDYISLHEIESGERQPLSIKLNIVEKGQAQTLKFTLANQNQETLLNYQRLNNYMLRLNSPHYVLGEAFVLVYEMENNEWRRIASIDISNKLTTSKLEQVKLAQLADKKSHCILTRGHKETLWSIASRYKDKWRVDIYSAILAIYKSNLISFDRQHIGHLMDEFQLQCPTNKTIAMLGTKEEAKTEFQRLAKIKYQP